jgi:hypothetical protein
MRQIGLFPAQSRLLCGTTLWWTALSNGVEPFVWFHARRNLPDVLKVHTHHLNEHASAVGDLEGLRFLNRRLDSLHSHCLAWVHAL